MQQDESDYTIIEEEFSLIEIELKKYDNAKPSPYKSKELLIKCKPILNSIKLKLGDENLIYLEISSAVVSRVLKILILAIGLEDTIKNIGLSQEITSAA